MTERSVKRICKPTIVMQYFFAFPAIPMSGISQHEYPASPVKSIAFTGQGGFNGYFMHYTVEISLELGKLDKPI